MSNIIEGKNKGQQVAGLFLNLKRVFDVVDQNILLYKLGNQE